FNATTAVVVIFATLVSDAIYYRRAIGLEERRQARIVFVAHIRSPFVALCLALFWIVPVINEYQYFVTRPFVVSPAALFTPALIAWYVVALAGCILWLRESSTSVVKTDDAEPSNRRVAWPYLGACVVLAGAILSGSVAAPGWFPLQTARFIATLTFMLAVPVGYALAFGFRKVA